MTREARTIYWLVGLLAAGILIHLLSDILLPFVAGMAVAYFLDPVADRLEGKGCSRAIATTIITVAFFAAVAGVVAVILPLLQHQIVMLIELMPEVIAMIRGWVEPYLGDLQAEIHGQGAGELKDAAGKYASNIIKWITGLLGKVWSGGLAFVHVLSVVLITPIVSFYLLREWDDIVAWVDGHLPHHAADEIREQAKRIDETMAGFIRGQASVCLCLATIYGVSLTLIGLNSGLLVGLGAGLVSFIPYFGAASGITVALAITFFQFGVEQWGPIAAVAALFISGQLLESYVLTPSLVGGRVGLHPLWIIFALMAGGALFGFTGVLLAVPVAAVIGVLLRYALGRYRDSAFFTHDAVEEKPKSPNDNSGGGKGS
ncbi:MAG: AI-2E family transporter [Rhodospirillaceae bacterium]